MARLMNMAIRSEGVLGRLRVAGVAVGRMAIANAERSPVATAVRHHCLAAACLRPRNHAQHAHGNVFCTSLAVRFLRGPRDKVPPTKPLHFDYSGDLDKQLPAVDHSLPRVGFENVPELKDADEMVQKIFSLDFGDGRDLRNRRIQTLIERVQDHPAEVKTLETKVAMQTVLIRNQMKHVLEFRKDKAGKSRLIERIQSRKKALKILRKLDYEKFEWLLQELRIKYVPTPKYNFKESKRAKRKRLAFEQGKAIRLAKIEAYRQKLEEEKVKFLAYKEQEMMSIQQQLKELGITEVTSLESTLSALGMAHMFERNPPQVKRRTLLLRKKFELYGIHSRKRGKTSVTTK